MLDPHSAVGLHVAKQFADASVAPLVSLATAHPAKFPAAVKQMSGRQARLPEHLLDLHSRQERLEIMPNDLATIQAFITEKTSVKVGETA